jgi:hypothetical protein
MGALVMALPATLTEAKANVALAFAREWIARAQEPGGLFHPHAEHQYGRGLMKEFALEHPFGCDEIVYFAENGSKEADLALRDLIAERTDRGESLGAVLGGYAIKLLNPLRPHRPGPTRAAHFVRDMGISMLVEALIVQCSLRASPHPASRRPSACGVAAQALTEAGIGISLEPKGVGAIWRRYLPVYVGTLAAARTRFAAGNPPGFAGLFGPRNNV